MGVAALILGIVSLLMFIFHSTWAAGCGLAAVIFAAIGMKKQKGLSIAGLVLGIIALVIGLIFFLACGECGMCRYICPVDAIDWNYPEGGTGKIHAWA